MTNEEVQEALVRAGYGPLVVDGVIGKKSIAALAAFIVNTNTVPTIDGSLAAALGKYLPRSPAPDPVATELFYPDFVGHAKPIDDIDLPMIARTIGCSEDEVHMLIDVETSGSGFDDAGRPKALFEPHRFWEELGPGSLRDRAQAAGLAYPKWGMKPYPKDSYPRIFEAMKLHTEAALKATSWGAAQIMGSNHKLAGYSSVIAFVNDMCEDEEFHIAAMIRFIVSSGLDDDLRRLAALTRPTTPEDCRIIARVYNGPGYEKNSYHIKMAAAHNKWRKIADTQID